MKEAGRTTALVSCGTFQTVYTIDVIQLDAMIATNANPLETFIDLYKTL